MLTPKEVGGAGVGPASIKHSVVITGDLISNQPLAPQFTICLGFKPTSPDQTKELNDPTAHYIIVMQRYSTAIKVWVNGVRISDHPSVSASTYAGVVMEVLAAKSGSHHGYYSRLQIVESAVSGAFWEMYEVPDVVVPDMSQACTGGTVLAVSEGAAEPAIKAFDGGTLSSQSWNARNYYDGYDDVWIRYTFPAGVLKRLVGYTVRCSDSYVSPGSNSAIGCKLYGRSSDGPDWKLLHTWSDTDWGHDKTVTFDNPTAYEQYQWSFQSKHDNLVVGEIVGHEAVPATYCAMRRLAPTGLHTLLDFSDVSQLGKDMTGNGHSWSMPGALPFIDTPTQNFIILNPLHHRTVGDLRRGNTISSNGIALGTMRPKSGKWTFKKDGVEYAYDAATAQFNPDFWGVYKFGAEGWVPTQYPTFMQLNSKNLPEEHVLSASYTGNGSANGPCLYTGCTLSSVVIDGTRYVNDGSASGVVIFFANGFKLVSATKNVNGVAYEWSGTLKYSLNVANAQAN